jgi:SAM-dependent methyltransferase
MNFMLTAPYRPPHEVNRMRDEGDVLRARDAFFRNTRNNLRFLVRQRYEWMSSYIAAGDCGVDIGCGAGLSREFIKAKQLLLTDFTGHDFLDLKFVDAMNTPFAPESFDFVIATNVIHHLPHPVRFFREARRILKAGGVLLVHEVHCSLLLRAVLRIMRHEGYSFQPDVFDDECVCTDPNDLWAGNNAIPDLLFRDHRRFEREVPWFRIERDQFTECAIFLNSGGVTAKTFYLPLPEHLLQCLLALDNLLSASLPEIFALGRRLVLRRRP